MTGRLTVSALQGLWRAPRKLTLSEWSEKNLVLSPEYSAHPGRLVLYGWQRPIFDSFTDDQNQEIVLMTATQLVKTLFLQACIAYAIAAEPGPILFGAPKDTDAETFSRERLSPMIRDCPVLSERVLPSKSRDSDNTVAFKRFPGGLISLVGTIAPGNLARRTIQYFLGDEIDKWEASAGVEGDPISLGRARTLWYGSRRKIVLASSPTVKGRSRIARAYETSDQRKAYVPCPGCGRMQLLRFGQVRWQDRNPGTLHYLCEDPACGRKWTDVERWNAAELAEWRPHAPFNGVAGFWINHLYSAKVSLADLVFGPEGFLVQKESRTTRIAFVNTKLAELWQDEGERPDWEPIYDRRERYPIGEDAVVPERAVFLTAGVDVQEHRLEMEVVAWGPGRESWSVDYRVLEAFDEKQQPIRTSSPEVWGLLEEALMRTYKHASGADMPILAMSIDVGHNPGPVYEFAKRHPRPSFGPAGILISAPRTVLCVAGADQETLVAIPKFSTTEAASKRAGIRVVRLGTGYLKQQLYDSLRVRPRGDNATPACCHFPDYSDEYFKGLVAETRIVTEAQKVSYRKDYPRNEPLDCRVYSMGAAAACGIERMLDPHWQNLRRTLLTPVVQPTAPQSDLQTGEPVPAAPARSFRPVVGKIRF